MTSSQSCDSHLSLSPNSWHTTNSEARAIRDKLRSISEVHEHCIAARVPKKQHQITARQSVCSSKLYANYRAGAGGGRGQWIEMIAKAGGVQKVPDREGVIIDTLHALTFRVAQKGAKQVGVSMLSQFHLKRKKTSMNCPHIDKIHRTLFTKYVCENSKAHGN